MFDQEVSYYSFKDSSGVGVAVEYIAGIHASTPLLDLVQSQKLFENLNSRRDFRSLIKEREFFDFNEHFIEISNQGAEMPRSLSLMIFFMLTLAISFGLYLLLADLFSRKINWITLAGACFFLFMVVVFYLIWIAILKSVFFTALRARYRFNRTTRKVYVLRPEKFGGNAVLDWERVRAHVNWTQPGSWTEKEIHNDPQARAARLERGREEQSLLLYWPPLDENDPERKGEDVLWVGSKGAGERLWRYIFTFMEKGMDAVPFPGPDSWLRKGFSGAGEHLEENVMHRQHQMDKAAGKEVSAGTVINYAANAPWSPLNSLAERLCYWPTFPEEWNSDCGQKRRESGIGPEEPLRWVARV